MTLIDHNANTRGSGDRPRDTVTSYFTRYRLALYLFSGAGVAAGVALNWNWLAAAGFLPVLAFLPCMLMMFMCMKHGAQSPNDPGTESTKILPSRSGKPLELQHRCATEPIDWRAQTHVGSFVNWNREENLP